MKRVRETNFTVDEDHIKRERKKAKELKKTNWWQTRLNKGICHYCGNKFDSSELTMDHIVPISRGGKSNKGNIVPACKKCNTEKKTQTPVDMILEELND